MIEMVRNGFKRGGAKAAALVRTRDLPPPSRVRRRASRVTVRLDGKSVQACARVL